MENTHVVPPFSMEEDIDKLNVHKRGFHEHQEKTASVGETE